MSFIMVSVIGLISFVVGVFGFSQIIGSLRTIKIRGLGASLFTVILWVCILIITAIGIRHFAFVYIKVCYIAYGISALLSLGSGANGVE